MAYIDKRCEYLDLPETYLGWKMRTYSRDRIQVNPQFWPLFAKAPHVLVIREGRLVDVESGGICEIANDDSYIYCTTPDGILSTSHGSKWKGPGYYVWTWKRHHEFEVVSRKANVRMEYSYDLYCPTLPGEVRGHYTNWTHDLSATKRRLKRLLKSKLNIVYTTELNIADIAEINYNG